VNRTSTGYPPASKRLLTVREAALLFDFGQARNLYRAIREGFIPPGPIVRLGRRVLVNRPLFEEWLASGGGQIAGASVAQQDGQVGTKTSPGKVPPAAGASEIGTLPNPGERPFPTRGGV